MSEEDKDPWTSTRWRGRAAWVSTRTADVWEITRPRAEPPPGAVQNGHAPPMMGAMADVPLVVYPLAVARPIALACLLGFALRRVREAA